VGDRDAPRAAPPTRVWVESFVVRRHPVTHGEYLEYLNDLYAAEGAEAARRRAPQELGATAGALTSQLYDDTGAGLALPAPAGDIAWTLDRPVVMVSWWDACAYAAWLRARTGLPWRLLTEWEWEKAARGVDGRFYPWGDRFDATWACLRESHPKTILPASIHAFPGDESPYGVRGCAGNMSDWCTLATDTPSADGQQGADAPMVVARGGAWSLVERHARIAQRRVLPQVLTRQTVGFRLARDL
jgi:serine/threonine-protein kinase